MSIPFFEVFNRGSCVLLKFNGLIEDTLVKRTVSLPQAMVNGEVVLPMEGYYVVEVKGQPVCTLTFRKGDDMTIQTVIGQRPESSPAAEKVKSRAEPAAKKVKSRAEPAAKKVKTED